MNKFLKRLALFGLSFLMLLSAGACGENPSGEQPGGEQPGGEQPGGEQPGGEQPGGSSGFQPYDETLRETDLRTLTPQEYTMLNLSATDDFGRCLVTVDGKENGDRYVGMFYFLWLGQNGGQSGIYDMSVMTNDGKDLDAFQDPNASPTDAYHFWGEPVWSYYNSTDEWVIRKQIEMLTLAGVDFLVFDCTNAYLYKEVTDVLFKVLLEYQNAGWNVPKFMYYIANRESYMKNLKDVYHYAYENDTYRSLWFAPDGKPIITMHDNFYFEENYGLDVNNPEEKAISETFQFRLRQWPNEVFWEDGIPWMEFTPNATDTYQPIHNGWMNVSVAQHVTVRFSDTVGTQGRGYDHRKGKTDHKNFAQDLNYISQWQTVLEHKDEVRFTFVTGWNEWIALKMKDEKGTFFTVDTFIAEYSRDLEPSENLGDNSYLLTAQKIRENNYTAAKHYQYPATTIDISKDDAQWADVRSYVDFTNDCLDRNGHAFGTRQMITDESGRNDISNVKVARDGEYLYFRVETAKEITPYEQGDTRWMNLWIKTRNAENTYFGYDYVINRNVSGGKSEISHANANGALEKSGEADIRVEGNVMFVRVKLSDLGLGGANYDIEFKVTDNVSLESVGKKYLDFYRTGDSAPIGRLNYRFGY